VSIEVVMLILFSVKCWSLIFD